MVPTDTPPPAKSAGDKSPPTPSALPRGGTSASRGWGWSRRKAAEGVRAAALPVLFAVAVIALWEFLSRVGVFDELVVPSASSTFEALVDLLGADYLPEHVISTVEATVAGFLLGSFVAFAIGSATILAPALGRAIYPTVVALQMLPKVALAPVFIAWLGFGITPKIVMAATICFFPVLVNTAVGLTTVSREEVLLFRSLRASRWQEFVEFRLPSAAPEIFAGLKTAMSIALIGAIVLELVGTKTGLGTLIARFSASLDIARTFAVLMILVVIGLILYAIVEIVDRKVVFWTERDHVRFASTKEQRPL
jgi:NitT/TauT family transport system permease protein